MEILTKNQDFCQTCQGEPGSMAGTQSKTMHHSHSITYLIVYLMLRYDLKVCMVDSQWGIPLQWQHMI